MNGVRLPGCRIEPLASYLKALAVFRIIGTQADNTVAGYWEDGVFVLDTTLSFDEIVSFLQNDYSPTPILSPWNGGSGFWPNDVKARKGMDAILATTGLRFDPYRKAIRAIQTWPEFDLGIQYPSDLLRSLEVLENSGDAAMGKKAAKGRKSLLDILAKQPSIMAEGHSFNDLRRIMEDHSGTSEGRRVGDFMSLSGQQINILADNRRKEMKGSMGSCRMRMPEACIEWFDTAVVITADGTPSYFPLLGSGGNDGRLDYSSNFMQAVMEMLIANKGTTGSLLRASLTGQPSNDLVKSKIGQFDPGRAGGFNMGEEVETKDFSINPWDFLLLLEGSVMLTASATRRSLSASRGKASLPFTVRFSPVGYTSDSESDEGKAETWLPTWNRPATLGEVVYLFSEGRCTLGRKQAENGIDFCRAVGTLGVDRGLTSFTRYSYVVRRGNNLVALPSGSISVGYRPQLALLDQLDPIIRRLDFLVNRNPPASILSLRRNIDEELFACSRKPAPQSFMRLVRALGRMEMHLSRLDHGKEGFPSRPLSGLSQDWIRECLPAAPEVALAASLASIRRKGGVGPIRSNTSGSDPEKPWEWGDLQQCWRGSTFPGRMVSALLRRLTDMTRTGGDHLPLSSHISVRSADAVPFIFGMTDDRLLEELLFGFTLVDWRKEPGIRIPRTGESLPIPRSWALLKLFLTGNGDMHSLGREARVVNLLTAGRIRESCETAAGRLRNVAGQQVLSIGYERETDPLRLAAALLLPVWDIDTLRKLVSEKKEEL